MKVIVVYILGFLCCSTLFSQECHKKIMAQSTMWDADRIDKVLNEKINAMFDYQKDKYIPLINYAKEHCDATAVFHANFSFSDSVIEICLADYDFPLDLVFTNSKSNVRLVVLTYQGKVEIVDTAFASLMRGLANKQSKAFRYIIKQKPDLVFVSMNVFGCIFYVCGDTVYVYDYYNQEKGRLQDYSRLLVLFDEKEM